MHKQTCSPTAAFICRNTKREAKQKGLQVNVSVPFPPVSLLILFFFACFLISPQTTFTFAALPHPPPSLSPSSSSPSPLHLSLLSHLFCISNLGCFKVNVCVRLSHNPGHTYSRPRTHTCLEKDIHSPAIPHRCALVCVPPPPRR